MIRPKLRADVRFVECPDGVYVHSDHGVCTLRGDRAYAWLSRLGPALTGERTLAELTEGLPDAKRAVVEGLVASLAEQRFVVDARDDEPHTLTAAEQRTYAAEIAFIGYALDSPQRRFDRLRRTRLTLVGTGPLLRALVAACLTAGWRQVRVVVSTVGDLDEVVRVARRDPAQRVQTDPPPALVADADVVLQIDTERDALLAMARACHDAGVVLGQALVRPDEIWLSRVGPPAVTGAGSGWRRLVDAEEAAEEAAGNAADADGGAARWLTGPVPDIVAAELALAAFAERTGLDAVPARGVDRPSLVRVDLATLAAQRYQLLPHPAERPATTCRHHGADATRRAIDTLAASAEIAVSRLLADTGAAVVNPRTGLLDSLDEGELPQSPLWVCRAAVAPASSPRGSDRAGRPVVLGWGGDQETARSRAVLAGLACYGFTAGPAGSGGPGRWGMEPDTGRMRPLPPAAVLAAWPVPPSASTSAAADAAVPAGVAAGLSWSAAVGAGLRGWCEALLGEQVRRDSGRLPSRDPESLATDGSAGWLREQLDTAGVRVRALDLTAVLGVPAVALLAAGRPPVVSCAPEPAQAVRDGLERVLLGWQLRDQHDPRSVVAAPRWLDGVTAAGVDLLCAGLRRAGRVPLVVPLDSDPAAARILPFVAWVVLDAG